MTKKYEFTGETKVKYGRTLRRIRRLSDGLVGGWIESEKNLSQEGSCFVYNEAAIYENARVYDNCHIYDKAEVYGNARVYDNAMILGNTQVFDSAIVFGKTHLFADTRVFGSAKLGKGKGHFLTLGSTPPDEKRCFLRWQFKKLMGVS